VEITRTIIKPIIDRYIIISNVSNSKEISRPETAIAENETIVPVIQNAARVVVEKDLITNSSYFVYPISFSHFGNAFFI
tara:strand:+ start:55 stop:291 length:237 start_codon:yes stop_codon:yes gene_type:complete